MTSCTPDRPRVFKERKNAVQNAPSSLSPTSNPRTSRCLRVRRRLRTSGLTGRFGLRDYATSAVSTTTTTTEAIDRHRDPTLQFASSQRTEPILARNWIGLSQRLPVLLACRFYRG